MGQYPTLKMPYRQVAVVHASAGMRRVVALLAECVRLTIFQHVMDFEGQRPNCVGFGDEIDPFIEHTVLGDDIVGIARCEQDLQMRQKVLMPLP